MQVARLYPPPTVGEDRGEGDLLGHSPGQFANLKIRS